MISCGGRERRSAAIEEGDARGLLNGGRSGESADSYSGGGLHPGGGRRGERGGACKLVEPVWCMLLLLDGPKPGRNDGEKRRGRVGSGSAGFVSIDGEKGRCEEGWSERLRAIPLEGRADCSGYEERSKNGGDRGRGGSG